MVLASLGAYFKRNMIYSLEVEHGFAFLHVIINPKHSFDAFNKNLIKLAKLYTNDFSITKLRRLSYQLGKFIFDVYGHDRFIK